MRRRFTVQPSEIRQYSQQGYLLKTRFIPGNKINEAHCYCEKLIQKAFEQRGEHFDVYDSSGNPCVIGDLPLHQPKLVTLLASLDIWKAVSQLLGTRKLAYHYAQLVVKHPESDSKVCWHRDFNNRYISPIHSDFLRIFIPISELTRENGAPLLIPGSNKINDGAVKISNQKYSKQFPESRVQTCHPGDIVFLHPKTLHASPANHSKAARISLVMQIARSGTPLNNRVFNEKLGGCNRLQLIHYLTG